MLDCAPDSNSTLQAIWLIPYHGCLRHGQERGEDSHRFAIGSMRQLQELLLGRVSSHLLEARTHPLKILRVQANVSGGNLGGGILNQMFF